MKMNIEEIIIFALSFFFASLIVTPIEKRIGLANYNLFEDGFDIKFIFSLVLFVVVALIIRAGLEEIAKRIKNR